MSEGLLPCPFCGCEGELNKVRFARAQPDYLATCSDSKCRGYSKLLGPSRKCEIDRWNTRYIHGHKVTFNREAAGMLCEPAVWVVIDDGYLYGPCDCWEEVAELIRTEWKPDRHLVG